MTCEAEERALAEIRTQKSDAEQRVQREKANAESALLRLNESVYDWGAVRLAAALARRWDERCVRAERALAQCKKRRKQGQHD